MKIKRLGYFLWILALGLGSCKTTQEPPIDPGQLPKNLFYSTNEVFVCTGETFITSIPKVEGTSPMQFSLETEPNNPKIRIDESAGTIQIMADSPTGSYKAHVKVCNRTGNMVFKNIITFYISAFDPAGVNFENDVKPLVQIKCDPCHTSGGGRDWTNLNNTKKYILNIIEKTTSGEMPQNEAPLSSAEIQIFRDWLNNCFLEK
jgi:hypothetical protein